MGCLDIQSAAEKIGDGHYQLRLHEDWKVWGPNGGYLAACALRAAGAESQHALPVSYFGQYLRVPVFSEVNIHVDCIKPGRSASAYSVRMVQNDKLMLQAQVWTADSGKGLEHCYFPHPSHFKPLAEAGQRPPVGPMPFWDNLEIRQIKNDDGHFGHWYRFVPEFAPSDAFLDAARSLILIDTMQWPAAWHAHSAPDYVAPSLDLYVRFHGNAEPSPWLFSNAVADTAKNGLLAGSGAVWNEAGNLVATGASQSLCIPT